MHDDVYIGGRSENNIKCVVHDDLGWKNQTTRYILLRHWLYEWFSQFHICGTYSVLSRSHSIMSDLFTQVPPCVYCVVCIETCVFAYLGMAIFSFQHIVKPALVVWSVVSSTTAIATRGRLLSLSTCLDADFRHRAVTLYQTQFTHLALGQLLSTASWNV